MSLDLADRQRASLIKTITKIREMDPELGRKWQRNMLKYYYERLAELMLRQTIGAEPTSEAVVAFVPEVQALVNGTQDLAP